MPLSPLMTWQQFKLEVDDYLELNNLNDVEIQFIDISYPYSIKDISIKLSEGDKEIKIESII
jgi:hypothetical protein